MDETGFAATPLRTHAWAIKGQKVHRKCSAHQRSRTHLLGASLSNRLLAPLLCEGTCHTRRFNAWLEQERRPRLITGPIIVMDNASFHQSARTRELIEKVGYARLYLPPYSPDLNPTE
ncbi:MAG TPA: transposase [Accumulibacter sp.]|nr:transposase [Accumulibacter sp.]HMY06261.1 transposase [Accumulibacter sp.]HNC19004.1 transposase [Accumulibacter sp.]HND81264.1 transposase [Accumulibacter sp.]HNE13946.1 transposase [Accumulibacter sp.]